MTHYIGIDPSFTKTGLAIINIEDKIINFYTLSPKGTNDVYRDFIMRSLYIVDSIHEHTSSRLRNELKLGTVNIKENNDPIKKVVVYEEPAYSSMRASSLGILSGVIGYSFYVDDNTDTVYTINANVINSMNKSISKRTGLNKKQTSKQIALDIIDIFKAHDYNIVIDNENKKTRTGKLRVRELSPDEAEAFLMILHYLIKFNILDDKLKQEILKVNRNLNGTYSINELK